MAIVAISGRKSSGKNLVANIIQYLIYFKNEANYLELIKDCLFDKNLDLEILSSKSGWQQKQFANKIKDIVCLLIGCTKEDLENKHFKNKVLPEQWWVWKLEREGGYSTILLSYLTTTKKELEKYSGLKLFKPTVRSLLQQIGTNCFRNLIHPDIWVTSLFNEYKTEVIPNENYSSNISKPKNWIITREARDEYLLDNSHLVYKHEVDVIIPSWIITDMRFKNELKAVKDRNGITIRVNRYTEISSGIRVHGVGVPHISETELDNETFDYIIDNNSDIEELIEKVKQILILEKLL